MSRHRKVRNTARRKLVRASVAAAVAVALVVGVVAFIQPNRAPLVADLGTSVSTKIASSIAPARVARSSVSVKSNSADVKAGSYRVKLRPGGRGASTKSLTGKASATIAGEWTQVGSSKIQAAQAAPANSSATGPAAVTTAIISVQSSKEQKRQGVQGVTFTVRRDDGDTASAPVGIRVPSRVLSGQFGADYASRLRWVQLPEGQKLNGRNATPVASARSKSATILTPMASSQTVTVAATAAPVSSSGTGSFSATSLKPSSTWDVSAQTGDFSWSYPFTVPPTPAGPVPNVSLAYDSQSVDGETGSTNNQTSSVGEGWDVAGGGFIERQYVSCSEDDGASGPVKTSGDLCWKVDNAVLNLGGNSTPLVRDSDSGTWVTQNDDGSRVEHLVGTSQGCAPNGTYDNDCWRVTATDGTQYYFGKNQLPGWSSGKATTNSTWTVPVFGNDTGEPCHASTFATSSCDQAWRWNLDYIVDVHDNAEALYYYAETNRYGKNGAGATEYVRGGQLNYIAYGLTSDTVYTSYAAAAKVTFVYDAYGRCRDSTQKTCTAERISVDAVKPATPAAYPDVPFDQLCTSSCAANAVPTFWTTARLSAVKTSYKSGTTAYTDVDRWTLSHSYPDPGDGTDAALWLTQVQHTGHSADGDLTEPATKFAGVTMQNRVWPTDGLAPLDKWRIVGITSSTGAVTSINYAGKQCSTAQAETVKTDPGANIKRCFPQWWSPSVKPAVAPKLDVFHKYVVLSVIDDPKTGGGNDRPLVQQWVYSGGVAWRYNNSPFIPEKRRTWSDFAGYGSVDVRVGGTADDTKQDSTVYTFFRGLDGDRAAASGGTKSVSVDGVTDSRWLAGFVRSTEHHNGVGGDTLSTSTSTPWVGSVKANDGRAVARAVSVGATHSTEPTSTGSRTADTTTNFNSHGNPTQISTETSDAGATCSTTTYAPANTEAWLIDLPREEKTVGQACDGSSSLPKDLIGATRHIYDNGSTTSTPTTGEETQTDTLTGFDGATPTWDTTSQSTFDARGRTTSSTDALNRQTTIAYSAAEKGPITRTTSVNAKGWSRSTDLDPARGSILQETDVDGSVTTADYDALGRRTKVWLPGRSEAANAAAPSISYTYTQSQTSASAVATKVLKADTFVTSYDLFDGLGRAVQTQLPSSASGSVVTDTWYDDHARANATNNDYWASGQAPSSKLIVPVSQQQIASNVEHQFEPSGRETASITNSYGEEQFRTTTRYPGADRVDTIPPSGGTPTSSFTNSRGNQVRLSQYLGTSTSGAHQDTTYAYNSRGDMTAMTGPAGNRWTWEFDVAGNKVLANDPDTGSTRFTYDAVGNQTSSTDARGVTLTRTYDELDRQTQLFDGDAKGALLTKWTYDTVKRGRLTTSASYVGSKPGTPGDAYSTTVGGYTAQNNPTQQTVSIPASAPAFGGLTYTTSMTYAADGSPSTILEPSIGGIPDERVTWHYNALGDVSDVSGIKSYAGVVYDALNRVAQVDRDGSVANYSAYTRSEVTGDVTGITEFTGTGSKKVVLADRTYTRDASGNITRAAVNGSAGTEAQCYSYDALQELTEAWTPTSANCSSAPAATALGGPAPYWQSFTYDPLTGNRTGTLDRSADPRENVSSTYTYPSSGSPRPHAVQSVSSDAPSASGEVGGYTYDAAGNTTKTPSSDITWDSQGHVSTTTVNRAVQSNTYDAEGNLRLQSDSNSNVTLFLGDTELSVAGAGAEVTAVRTYAIADITVAERSSGSTGMTLRTLNTDLNGTADIEVDASTGAITRRWFTPFGTDRGPAAPWSSGHGYLNATTNEFSGTTQVGSRQYSGALGRFLSPDAVLAPSNPLQNNGYSYSANNPIANADPTGDCYLSIGGGIGTSCAGGTEHPNPHAATGRSPGAPQVTKGRSTYVPPGVDWRANLHREVAAKSASSCAYDYASYNCGTYIPVPKVDLKQWETDVQLEMLWQKAMHDESKPRWLRAAADWQHRHQGGLEGLAAIYGSSLDLGGPSRGRLEAPAAVPAVKDAGSSAHGGSSATSAVTEGIYVIKTSDGTYVGQSGDINKRFKQHLGRFTAEDLASAERIEVRGGKTSREIAEQLKLDSLRDDGATMLNKVNPIGPKRIHLMGPGYSRPGL